jgi:lipid A 3-O-deacylase
MDKKFILLLTICLALLPCFANAETGLSIASGYGVANIVPLRIAVQKSWQQEWRKDHTWSIKGFWELTVYHLSGKKGALPNSNRKLDAIAFAPVFRLSKQTPLAYNTYPYVEFAIGIAQLSKREIGGRWQGIKFAFEDRLGVGLRFGNDQQYDLNYRAVHFSNAYMGNYNHGINLHMLTFGIWF